MAYKMARPQDFIEVKNRDFYRNWSFELKNAPYGIKISNQTFRDSIKVDFTARNYIELKNTVLKPNASGSISLSINPNTPLPVIPSSSLAKNSIIKQSDNISFFDNGTFILQHFLVDGVQQDLILTHPILPDRFVPLMMFTFNTDINQLEANIGGYCNFTSAKYKDKSTYLEVIERGGTTLEDCGGGENEDYFNPITGNYYSQRPPEKVFYEITQNRGGLWLWVNENHKLYFTKETLSIEEEKLQNSIKIYPNPTNNYIEIQTNNIQILEISIIDIQGKVVLKKTNKFKKIDVSKFTSGMYFIKIKSKKATITKKIIIEFSR